MKENHRILLIEHSESDSDLITRHLVKEGIEATFTSVSRPKDIGAALRRNNWDVIICAHHFPLFTSAEIINFRSKGPSAHIPLILVSGTVEDSMALELMRNGVSDFVPKNDLSRLAPVVSREIKNSRVGREKIAAQKALQRSNLELREALRSLDLLQNKLSAGEKSGPFGEMAGGIARDLDQSLTTLQGTMEVLKMSCPEAGKLVELMAAQIEDSAAAVSRLHGLCGESAGNAAPAVELSSLLKEIKDSTAPRWKRSGSHRIKFEIECPPEVEVECEASKLREVLNNLVFNAIEAIGDREDGAISLKAECDSSGVMIEVTDNGCGMDGETLDRCLKPRFTTKGIPGTGFGLAIVDSLVQSFGERIRIESRPGRGSKFSFKLKTHRHSHHSPRAIEPESSKEKTKSLKVIVVDDEPIVATLVKRLLERLDHQATAFNTAKEVIEEIGFGETSVPDVIISDRLMPEVGGDELAKIVREGWPDTRFVMLSGFGDLMQATGERPFGVDMVLAKPLSFSSLEEGLELLFATEREEIILAN